MRISDWSSDVCSSDLTFETDPRIARFDGYIERELGGKADELMKAHPIGAKIPQECGSFMTTSFQSSNPVMISRIPDFYHWFLGADVTFRYEVHKMWLQHRSEERRVGKECVSKCRYRGSPNH